MSAYDKKGHEYDSDVRGGLNAREKIAQNEADWEETKKLGKGYTKADELRDAEDTRDTVKKDFEAGKKGKGEGDDGNSFWVDSRKHKKRKGFWNRRRAAAAGGAAGISIMAAVGLGGVATGPFQLIHLGQILGGNFAGQEDAASQRMQGLFRYIRSGNIGETRLTYIQSKMNTRMQATLAKNGITINASAISGQATTVSIDTKKNPQYSGLSKESAIAAIAADNGIDPAKINQIADGKFAFNVRDATISQKRSVIRAAVNSQGIGRIAAAHQLRVLTRYYNAPSILHPFKKLTAKGDAAIAQAIADWKKKRTEKVKATTPEAKARLNKAKSAFGAVGGSILAVQGAVCVVREIASDINQINYENVVVTGQKVALDAVGMGNQTEIGGEDMDARLAGAVVDGFHDKKTNTTIWDSKPLKAEQGIKGGVEVDADIKAAHNSNGTAASIVDFIDSTLAGKYTCSDVALIAGTLAGLALIPLTGGGSALATNALKAGTAAVALAAITTIVPRLLADEVIPQDLSGAAGGGIAAFGARSAANSSFIPSAGVALSATQSAQLEEQERQEDREEFRSKSFASRMFDLKDHRSLIAQVMQTQSTNPTRNFANLARSFMGTGSSSVASLMGALTPRAHAYEVVPYDYGFPRYGFSQEDLDNPNTQDPYDNADKAAQLLSSTPSYISDAKTCFGVDITKGTHGWQIVPVKDINVTSAEYTSVNCAKPGDLNWLRIRMFIFDSRTMNAYACYEGDQEACALENPNNTPPQAAQAPGGSAGYGATAEQLEGLPEACKNGSASGSVRMLCVGAKYRNLVPYLYGGNPRNGKQFSELWNSNKRDGLATDCSLFVAVALWDAYGTDATSSSGGYVGLTDLFDKIPLEQAQPGDLAVNPGVHIGIVNVPGQSALDSNTTHPGSPVDDLNIHPWGYSSYQYALRYKGPNAQGTSVKVGGAGGGNAAEQNGQGIQIEGVDDLIKENQFPSNTQIIPKVTNVVIHWLVSNPESPSAAGAAFNGTSVQFYVSQSGKIMQLTEFANTRAGHAKDSNGYAIGIEIGSPNGAGDSPPYNSIQNALLTNSNQKNQVIKLTTAIARKFGIKNITVGNQPLYTQGCTGGFAGVLCASQQEVSAFGIVGHYQLQNDKYDPGRQYIMEIQQAVKANLGL